jgi:endonuclease/exonuclease/phosphatase family metal-dependent hydrolase
MKVYSWNVYCYNRKLRAVCEFIERLDFDVLCLQEVTPELLECLKGLPYEIAYHIDVIRLYSPRKEELNYVVILSRHPMEYRGTLQFPDIPFPRHTRAFISVMRIFRWTLITERGSVYADIRIGKRLIRVFSAHLTLWGPSNRAEEFREILKHVHPDTPTIIGGDFNVIEHPAMKIINWLLGSPFHEALPWYPERALFEERFRRYGFKNPHRTQITHGFSRSQLDHILITHDLKAKSAWVLPDLHGSDHFPVGVELYRE